MGEILRDLGLTRLEIRIYKTLLDEGAISAGEISQKTGIHRRNVYDSLGRLVQKGLVSYIKENNRKIYCITNPEKVLDKLREREKAFEDILPELLSKYNHITEKKETLFFRGKEGLRNIFEDQIKEGKEILVNATTASVSQILKHFFPKYQLLRKERKIPTRMIFDDSYKNKSNSAVKKLPLCKVRYIKNFNRSPMSQYIYGNNTAIVLWGENTISILIRQKEIADGFRDSFELMWKLGK